eukprot:CAMPEP_0185831678 /NCGR_PEP_ID=MMETSP1353-20130828/1637_1 /TAXON_ID=1077150 /ORGANISM="Erythrolobus australicus, Strain CCMP3124" /LENGTH=294 /DNA_ID=CAMNT_0028529769 /DNA_START=77 /DNA_END=961 /DNA_ORIENTATION=+
MAPGTAFCMSPAVGRQMRAHATAARGAAPARAASTVRMAESSSSLSDKLKMLTERLTQQKEKVEVLERFNNVDDYPVISSEGDPRVAALLEQNEIWRKKVVQEDPDFFNRIANVQTPEILWIGCADSRVPANEIINMNPGDVFVHRNIANCVIHSDMSALSVMEFSIKYLKVKRIIVCGHYGCGGVKASMSDLKFGVIDNWLRHIRDVQRTHFVELSKITDEDAKFRRLCELNVIEQVHNVCSSTIVQSAWDAGEEISVHAWIYDVADGLLKDLGVAVSNPTAVNQLYRTKKNA